MLAKLRYRGVTKNHAWLKRRTAALNLRNLTGRGLAATAPGAGHLTRPQYQPGPQASPARHSGASLTPRPAGPTTSPPRPAAPSWPQAAAMTRHQQLLGPTNSSGLLDGGSVRLGNSGGLLAGDRRPCRALVPDQFARDRDRRARAVRRKINQDVRWSVLADGGHISKGRGGPPAQGDRLVSLLRWLPEQQSPGAAPQRTGHQAPPRRKERLTVVARPASCIASAAARFRLDHSKIRRLTACRVMTPGLKRERNPLAKGASCPGAQAAGTDLTTWT